MNSELEQFCALLDSMDARSDDIRDVHEHVLRHLRPEAEALADKAGVSVFALMKAIQQVYAEYRFKKQNPGKPVPRNLRAWK